MSVRNVIDTNRVDPAVIRQRRLADSHAIRDMVNDHRGWQVLKPRLSDRVSKVQAEIEAGIPDHAEYLRKAGELAGLRYVFELVEQAIRQADGGPEQ